MKGGSANAKWALLSAPMVLTLAIVFAVPIGWLIALSFFSMTGPAQVGDEISLENYRNFITDPFYYRIIFNTFWLGGVVVLCCLIVGYPVSYILARTKSRWRGLLLFLVVAPLLVDQVRLACALPAEACRLAGVAGTDELSVAGEEPSAGACAAAWRPSVRAPLNTAVRP